VSEEAILINIIIDKNNVSKLPIKILEKYESTFFIV
jgi:hypothetical protein